jgi:hypothetical protein
MAKGTLQLSYFFVQVQLKMQVLKVFDKEDFFFPSLILVFLLKYYLLLTYFLFFQVFL